MAEVAAALDITCDASFVTSAAGTENDEDEAFLTNGNEPIGDV